MAKIEELLEKLKQCKQLLKEASDEIKTDANHLDEVEENWDKWREVVDIAMDIESKASDKEMFLDEFIVLATDYDKDDEDDD